MNNAGVNPTFGYKTCIDINLLGLSLGVFLAMEKMSTSKGKKGGRIINVASVAGFTVLSYFFKNTLSPQIMFLFGVEEIRYQFNT